MRISQTAGIGFVVLAGSVSLAAQDAPELVARARAIHDRVIALDTHDDIEPAHFTSACNYTMPLATQVTLPKMKAGGLDVSFLIVYVGQPNPAQVPDAFQPSGYDRAYKTAMAKFDAVHRLTKEIAPNEIELALTPADVVRIAKSGKKVAVIGIENGYPIGTDVGRVSIDHVGIASDFDGGGGIEGWQHAGDTFNVTLELVRRGYTEEQIAKIWSGNLLRVWAAVEKIAAQSR